MYCYCQYYYQWISTVDRWFNLFDNCSLQLTIQLWKMILWNLLKYPPPPCIEVLSMLQQLWMTYQWRKISSSTFKRSAERINLVVKCFGQLNISSGPVKIFVHINIILLSLSVGIIGKKKHNFYCKISLLHQAFRIIITYLLSCIQTLVR